MNFSRLLFRKPTLAFLLFIAQTSSLNAQLAGTYSVPGSFSTITAAIANLNTVGVSGGVTVNIATHYAETAVTGGYVLTVTGSSLNPIVFQANGSGAAPLIIAPQGTATPTSARQGGVWTLVGCDYITIKGLSILDTNSVNPATMEYGIGFFKQSTGNGCHYNTVEQ